MPYSTSTVGFSEATRDYIVARLTAKLADLNAALSRDALTPLGTLAAATCITLGDPEQLPDAATTPLLMCVQGGGRLDGGDMQGGSITYFSPVSQEWEIYTSILIYLHPDAMLDTSAVSWQAKRERLMQRLNDWLRADVFPTTECAPTLTSREFAVSPSYDRLDMAHIDGIERGVTYKFANSQAVMFLHARHTGTIRGNH